jgi:chromosomal replication initiation ATPase DnaA
MILLAILSAAITLGMVALLILTDNKTNRPMEVIKEKQTDAIQGFIDQYCELVNVERKVLISSSRKREIAVKRQVAQYLVLLKYHDEMNGLSSLGAYFNRHHTTMIHSRKEVRTMIEIKDPYVLGILKKVVEPLGIENNEVLDSVKSAA